MRLQTIHVSSSDDPKFDFLLRRNYLKEYCSEVDKARVRQNLGIPDEYSFKWGNITGVLENQRDLVSFVTLLANKRDSEIDDLLSSVSALNKLTILQGLFITNILNSLPDLVDLAGLLNEMRTDIAQNASLIRTLGGTQSLEEITSKLLNHETRILDLEAKVNSLTAVTLQSLSLSKSNFTTTTDTAAVAIVVTAVYSNTSYNKVVTTNSNLSVTSTDNSVAKWENGKLSILKAGSATLTFLFVEDGKTVSKQITVNITIPAEVIYSYIAYADSWTNVLGIDACKSRSLTGTWNETTIKNQSESDSNKIRLWICIPSGSTCTVVQSGIGITLNKLLTTLTHANHTYDIYYSGILSDTTGTLNITIS